VTLPLTQYISPNNEIREYVELEGMLNEEAVGVFEILSHYLP
jgi:hypothetical protein